ncbi:hypothetical protein Tco_0265816 [Tanacetum coccineum]
MFESRQTTIPFPSRLNNYYCEEKKGSYRPQFMKAYSYGASHIDNSIPRKEKDLGSFTLPCYINNVCFDNALADLGASVSVMPLSTFLNLGLGELAHTKLTVELADRIMKYPKRIAENVLVGIELMRDQVDDLMPTIEEGDVIDEPMIDIIKTMSNESFDEYPSFCDFDQKIHIDLENMDGYRDQDMGDIILGEPFCKASCVEARRFDGLFIIHNDSDNVIYQMARSHPRFKHLSNAQCNKIKPFLKVNLHDKLNGISHPYQNLKSFNKGDLNLGPEYVQDAKMEEWVTRGHISVHELE